METRRSTRLSLKENSKNTNAFKASKQNSISDDVTRDGSVSPVPSKKSKSSYFDPDFSEKSDHDSSESDNHSEESDIGFVSPPQKRKSKGKTNSNKRQVRKSKQRYESESENSSDEFVQKPKSITEILQSQTQLKLSSDESDSSVESPPKRKKKSDGSPTKKKPSPVKKQFESGSSSDEFVKPNKSSNMKNDNACKTEPSNDQEETDNKAEYFDFTALVNKVKANNENNQTEPKAELEVKAEPENEVKPKLAKKSKKVKAETKPEEKKDLEVFELLAMGEDTDLSAKDIEESVSKSSEKNYQIPKQVEVLLDAPILKKKKTTDLEMTLRRRLNFIRRENQVYVHKVHILCWIAHGMHVNSVLNSADLLSLALSLLPSDKCYPSKRMDMNYLNQLIEWFAKKIKLNKEPTEDKKSKLIVSLQAQFQKLEAESKTDLCFMFICVIRALGIKCRLIVNLNVVPLKPTSDQLLPINAQKNDTNQPTSTKKMLEKQKSDKDKSSSSSSKKSKKGSETPKKEAKDKSKNTPRPSRSRSEKLQEKEIPKEKSPRSQSEKSKDTKRSSRSKSEKQEEKETHKEKSSRSQSEKCKDSERSSRSKSEKAKESDRSSRSKSEKPPKKEPESEESSQKETRRSTRSKPTDAKKQSEYFTEEKTSRRSERIGNSKSSYFSKSTVESKSKKSKESATTLKSNKHKKIETECSIEEMSSSDESEEDADDTFVPVKKKKIDRRVLSSEDDVHVEEKSDTKSKQSKMNYWLEVFLEAEEQWICVDISKKSYHCIQQLYNATSHPVRYIVAFNSDQTVKDVTRRYVPQYLSVTRKLRVDDNWWKDTLDPFKPTQTAQNQEEDEALDRVLEEQPLPTAISEYKNHPLYALKRHLLKFQAIYPPDAPPLGYVKGEPVYSRLCVHQLHGREMWIKEAKVVKMGEKPYKIVKGRQKKDKFGTDEGPKDLELFGLWQTEDYDPPVAQNGIVPRNSFGNVELFKPCMLPKGTVYLQIPGLQRIANKLNIDCAAAITGFEYSTNGWSYPVKDGFVVCEEYKDILLDAYNQEIEEAEKREKQKREERVYANWKRLIKGLFIREKLKRRYNFGDPGTSSEQEKSESK